MLAVTSYLFERHEAAENKLFNSWQLINQASSGNSGKASALEYINTKDCWVTVNKAAGEGIFYDHFSLPRAARCGSDLIRAFLYDGHVTADDKYLVSSSPIEPTFPATSPVTQTSLTGLDLGRNTGLGRPYIGDLKLISPWLSGLSVVEADLPRAVISGMYVGNIDARGADFTGSTFTDVYINRMKSSCSEFRHARFAGIGDGYPILFDGLLYANFKGALFSQVDIEDFGESAATATFSGSRFENAVINFVGSGSEFSFATFDSVSIGDNTFRGSNMMRASFAKVSQLGGGALETRHFSGTNISQADLTRIGQQTPGMLAEAVYCTELGPPAIQEGYVGDGPRPIECGKGFQVGTSSVHIWPPEDATGVGHAQIALNNRTPTQLQECSVQSAPGVVDSDSLDF